MPDPAPSPIPIPSPDTGAGGFRGWLLSHFRPFLNSLPGFVSSGELDKIAHLALAAGSLCGAVAAVLGYLAPAIGVAAGPLLGPFVGAMVTALAGYIGSRAKATDSTDSQGDHAPAVVVTDKAD